MTYIIKLRRDSSPRWTMFNPVLGEGEPGFERDTGRLKIGNGSARWNDLPYLAGGGGNGNGVSLYSHIVSLTPHPVYDDGPSLALLYENAKV